MHACCRDERVGLHDDTACVVFLHVIHQSTGIPRPPALVPPLQVHYKNTSVVRIDVRRQIISTPISMIPRLCCRYSRCGTYFRMRSWTAGLIFAT